jgi:hypothetical protein
MEQERALLMSLDAEEAFALVDALFARGGRSLDLDLWRFVQMVELRRKPECWLWQVRLNGAGYGQFYVYPRSILAHRYAYQRFVGLIPQGLYVCHTSDVKHCVAPWHLVAQTQKQNYADWVARSRWQAGALEEATRLLGGATGAGGE